MVDLNNFDINIKAYYRGIKNITCTVNNNQILFNNNDKITIDNNNIYLNNKLIANDPELTNNDLLELYKIHLINKGYKFI